MSQSHGSWPLNELPVAGSEGIEPPQRDSKPRDLPLIELPITLRVAKLTVFARCRFRWPTFAFALTEPTTPNLG